MYTVSTEQRNETLKIFVQNEKKPYAEHSNLDFKQDVNVWYFKRNHVNKT